MSEASVKLVKCKRALHDFPYTKNAPSCDGERKCPHVALLNIAVEGHCVHKCIYCYAQEYKRAWEKGPIEVYANIVSTVKKELERTDICPPIYISPATDAFQPVKEVLERTLAITKLLMEFGLSFYHVTKSEFVIKCLDIEGLSNYPYYHLQMTIETPCEEKGGVLSSASSVKKRMDVVTQFCKVGIPVVLRIDPIIIGFTDSIDELKELIQWASSVGVRHIIASTGRFKYITFSKLIEKLKQSGYTKEAEAVKKSYVKERGYYRVLLEERIKFHQRLKELVESYGMTYAVCQELSWKRGLDSSNLKTCHGVKNAFIMKKADTGFKPLCIGTCVRCSTMLCGIEKLTKHPLKLPLSLAQENLTIFDPKK